MERAEIAIPCDFSEAAFKQAKADAYYRVGDNYEIVVSPKILRDIQSEYIEWHYNLNYKVDPNYAMDEWSFKNFSTGIEIHSKGA